MDLVLGIAGGVLVGVIAALTLVAPLTKTTIDDKALAYAEKLEGIIESLRQLKK